MTGKVRLVFPMILCVVGTAMASTDMAAQIEEPEPLPPETVVDSLKARLDVLKQRLAEAPRNSSLRLARLRVQYALSVGDEAFLDAAMEEIERLRVLGGDARLDNLLDGYAGALKVISGKHAFWPHQKLSRVKDGLRVLDSSVSEAPEHVELRYLRLVSTYYLPFFFNRGESASDDLATLVSLLDRNSDGVPADVLVPATDFVLQNAELEPELEARLSELLDHARTSMRAS